MEAVIFAKPPRPGEVKSRLAEAIGPQAAASFAEAALVDTIERLGQVPGLELVLSTSRLDDNWPAVAQALPQRLQPAGDLGKKMSDAIDRALQSTDKVTLWELFAFRAGCAEGFAALNGLIRSSVLPRMAAFTLGSRVSQVCLRGAWAPQALAATQGRWSCWRVWLFYKHLTG